MSISDELSSIFSDNPQFEARAYRRFGVVSNPFPSANQSAQNPRLRVSTDDAVISTIRQFVQSGYRSQSIIIAGTQGVGKTNLLNYYQDALEKQFSTDGGIFIVRYLPDPEPSFDAIIRKVFSDLGTAFLTRLVEPLAKLDDAAFHSLLGSNIASADVRRMLEAFVKPSSVGIDELLSISLEWLMGGRVFNLQKHAIGVRFRLDTVESRISALRDLVSIGGTLGVLQAIFLLLDELEKQDSVQPKSAVLRFLFAIRALIDALPYRLFLMLAMTPVARDRYFGMVPALAGRLQNRVTIEPLTDAAAAVQMLSFYINEARKSASYGRGSAGGTEPLLSEKEMRRIFEEQYNRSVRAGTAEGVRPRDLLNAANGVVDEKLSVL